MRTLALLAGLFLLALRGQAEPLGDTVDPVTEPEDQLPAQDLDGAKDQDVAVSFDGPFARAAAGPRTRVTCYCRPSRCNPWERRLGTCTLTHRKYIFCCR